MNELTAKPRISFRTAAIGNPLDGVADARDTACTRVMNEPDAELQTHVEIERDDTRPASPRVGREPANASSLRNRPRVSGRGVRTHSDETHLFFSRKEVLVKAFSFASSGKKKHRFVIRLKLLVTAREAVPQ
ncbi:hypothetical protein FHS46_002806 [Variibacter gotjawalensis]|nr:hypothetical protein [Variibacter gotjawalensis]NIK48489.1 hypothetical protein [Variibacter gotjawalensis]